VDARKKQIAAVLSLGATVLVTLFVVNSCSGTENAISSATIAPPATKIFDADDKNTVATDFVETYVNFGWDTDIGKYQADLKRFAPNLTFSSYLGGLAYADCIDTKCRITVTSTEVTATGTAGEYGVNFTTSNGLADYMLVTVSDFGQVEAYEVAPTGDGG
jgi:hypothetical protein